jgi:hypothetical protein
MDESRAMSDEELAELGKSVLRTIAQDAKAPQRDRVRAAHVLSALAPRPATAPARKQRADDVPDASRLPDAELERIAAGDGDTVQ